MTTLADLAQGLLISRPWRASSPDNEFAVSPRSVADEVLKKDEESKGK